MDMDIAQFRLDFPEFTDTTRYPDSQITFWGTLAEAQLNVCAWGTMKPFAVELYVAHEITLAAQSQLTASNDGFPGGPSGVAQSKTVGQVSISYDTASSTEKDAGWWNLTNYGKQLYRLMMMYGSGAIQL